MLINYTIWSSNLFSFLYPAVSHVFHSPGFSESRFFRVHVFQVPGFSGSRFFWVQVFLVPGFSGSRFFRVWVQVLEVALKICSKFTGEHPCRSVIEITLRHGCSPVNLLHNFRNWNCISAQVFSCKFATYFQSTFS